MTLKEEVQARVKQIFEIGEEVKADRLDKIIAQFEAAIESIQCDRSIKYGLLSTLYQKTGRIPKKYHNRQEFIIRLRHRLGFRIHPKDAKLYGLPINQSPEGNAALATA